MKLLTNLRLNFTHLNYRKFSINIYAIDSSIKNFPEEKLLNNLLYGSLAFNNDKIKIF